MASKYTVQEMREIAEQIDDECADAIADERTIASEFDVDTAQTLRDMLRQAADEIEREKKYEYSVVLNNGQVDSEHTDSYPFMSRRRIIVRREVGEWEEVSND